jgi:hypothetical protein
MNKSKIAFVIIALSTTSIACTNDNQKLADAKAEVVEAKEDLAKANVNAAQSAEKAATVEEWKLFKIDADAKIQKNEAEIAQLKISFKKSGKELDENYVANIKALEQKNKEISAKVNDYETSQSDWAVFRRTFDSDMESIDNAIKDLRDNHRK